MAERTRQNNGNGKHVWRGIVIAILAVIVLAAFISSRKGEVPVRVDHVTKQDLITTISTNGKVEPMENFEAHAPAPTTVRKIYVREGQRVRQGELLMQLDDADARAQAARALAQTKAAEADQHAGQLTAYRLGAQQRGQPGQADKPAGVPAGPVLPGGRG